MERYKVVHCSNCGTEYNPKDRPICPATDCEQVTPGFEPKAKKQTKAAAKVSDNSDNSEE